MRDELRQRTSAHHRDAERAASEHASVETLEGYRRFLECMLAAHYEFGALLDSASRAIGVREESARRIAMLQEDLAELGSTPLGKANPESMELDSLPRALGVGYVFEGSALGAAVLAERVSKAHGSSAPSHYLSFLADRRGERWPRVTEYLAQSDLDVESTVAAAERTFAFLTERMQRDD